MATKSTTTKMTAAKKSTGKQNTCSSCLSIKLEKLVKNKCVTCIEQKKAKKNEAGRQSYLKRTPEQKAKYKENARVQRLLKKQQPRIENVEITIIVSAVAATRPIPPPRDRSKLSVFTAAAAPTETAIVTRPTPPPRDRSKLSVFVPAAAAAAPAETQQLSTLSRLWDRLWTLPFHTTEKCEGYTKMAEETAIVKLYTPPMCEVSKLNAPKKTPYKVFGCDILHKQNDIGDENTGLGDGVYPNTKTEEEMIDIAVRTGSKLIVKNGTNGRWYLKGRDRTIEYLKEKLHKHDGNKKHRKGVFCVLLE